MSHTPDRHQDLRTILDRLKLAGMSKQFADLALRATKEGLSHEAYLHELAQQEEALRQERRTERLLRQSGLPLEKTFRTFDLARLSPTLQLQIERLKPGTFLESTTNVIAVGKPGCGKSHLVAALVLSLFSPVRRYSGRQPVRLSNAYLPPNETCACPRSWPNWTNMPVLFSMISGMSSMTVMKWRCCLRFFRSVTSANR